MAKLIIITILNILQFLINSEIISEITLTIKGTGEQTVIGNHDKYSPSEILINGVPQNYVGTKVYDLEGEDNEITIRWDYEVEHCVSMFQGLSNILTMDLSKFDSSKVTSMNSMFFGCSSLTSINFENVDTSSVKNMQSMFGNCQALTSLDLSSFDTSSVTTMGGMFAFCSKLLSLDLSNFDTSSVKDMSYMFDHSKLETLDLSNFDTSSVINMNNMFYYATLLVSLNIKLDTSSAENMDSMFAYCTKLLYLDLMNIETSSVKSFANILDGTNQDLIFCIDEEKNFYITSYLSSLNPNYINNCSDNCFLNSKKVIISETSSCVLECKDDYIYEYNNICYRDCPDGTHISSDEANICVRDRIEKSGTSIIDSSNESIEKNDEDTATSHMNKDKKLMDLIEECNPKDLFENNCEIDKDNISIDKDLIIEYLRYGILNGTLDELLSIAVLRDNKDLITRNNKTIYQITSTYNQNNKLYNNISNIILGKCEVDLKDFYNISENDSLIILKIDYFEEGVLIPKN